MFRFASPDMLYLLLLIPALIGLYIVAARAKSRRLGRFGNPETLAQLMPDVSPKRVRGKFIIYLCSLTLIIVSLARPQVGSKFKETTKEGIEIVIVVDVSNSMMAQDFQPNRLEYTKFAINHMIEGLKDDQIGLVVFAGDAYIQLPITSDYVAARNFVRQVSTTTVSKQGTNIGAAIDLATSCFSSESDGSRVVILITDGEDHGEDAIAAAEKAKAAGIKIYTIGVGTPEGAPIKIGEDYIKDDKGEMVVSKLDEQGLQQIALSTGGGYIRANNKSIGLNELVGKIRETQSKKFKATVFDEFDEQYQYPLAVALALLLIEMVIISRKNRLLSRFDIFKKEVK